MVTDTERLTTAERLLLDLLGDPLDEDLNLDFKHA